MVADPQCSQRGPAPLQILEGRSIIIIIPLSTKAVIQLHKSLKINSLSMGAYTLVNDLWHTVVYYAMHINL